nr:putative ribonuclease H-like domain-containing protein [Tanacetum cinerariifolium]
MPSLEDIGIFKDSHDDEDVFGAQADFHNLDFSFKVSPILTTRIHKDHPFEQVIGDLHSAPQIRRMSKNLEEHGLVGTVILRTDNKDLQNCLFTCFLSQLEPKKVLQALKDPSWIEAMQEELLQFKLQEHTWNQINGVRKRAIGSKWVFINKMDERGIVIRNKARLVAQGHTKEEGIDYDEVFTIVARIEAIRLFLAYASFKDFIVYQMDVKSAFLYGKIEEEVPDIMFAVCACARYQVTPKVSRLHVVKRIFRYLKGQPKLGLWYPKDSSFNLVAYTNTDYAGASLDRKSTTGRCHFLGCRLISWQCKKQIVIANSTNEVEYVTASSCCGQVNAAIDVVKVSSVKHN